MEGGVGRAVIPITCHVGATGRQLAVGAAPSAGARKERGVGKKERETAAMSSGTRRVGRENGCARVVQA